MSRRRLGTLVVLLLFVGQLVWFWRQTKISADQIRAGKAVEAATRSAQPVAPTPAKPTPLSLTPTTPQPPVPPPTASPPTPETPEDEAAKSLATYARTRERMRVIFGRALTAFGFSGAKAEHILDLLAERSQMQRDAQQVSDKLGGSTETVGRVQSDAIALVEEQLKTELGDAYPLLEVAMRARIEQSYRESALVRAGAPLATAEQVETFGIAFIQAKVAAARLPAQPETPSVGDSTLSPARQLILDHTRPVLTPEQFHALETFERQEEAKQRAAAAAASQPTDRK